MQFRQADVGEEAAVAETSTSSSSSAKQRPRIRQRVPKSCLPCLSGKRACDRAKPICSRCVRTQHDCIYADEPLPVPRMARAAQKHMRAAVEARQRKSVEGSLYRDESHDYDDNGDDDDEDDEDDDGGGGTGNQSVLSDSLTGEKRRKVSEGGAYIHSNVNGRVLYGTSPLSSHPQQPPPPPPPPTAPKVFDETHDDSDVHKAGQALVNLQSTAPWSSRGGSIPSPSTLAHYGAAPPQGSVDVMDLQQPPRHHASQQSLYPSLSSSSAAHPVPATYTSAANTASGGARSTMGDRAGSLRSNSTGATPSRMRESGTEDGGTHVNVNGQPLWHGETVIGSTVFNQVSSSNADDSQNMPSSGSEIIPANIQNAFNGLLYPMTDSFPFETIWSSGSTFKQEVLPLLPSYKKGRAVLDSFKRFVRTASPGLLDNNVLVPALDFLCKRRRSPEERAKRELISLPWLASFLMIVAVGQESQRTCGSASGEESGESEGDGYDDDDEDDGGVNVSDRSVTPNKANLLQQQPKDMRKHCDLLLSATYQALRLCSFLGSPNLQTIYAQLLIGVYLLHTERASNAWPILGNVMRQAQSIGLHVEPSHRLLSEERELRRKLWWTIIQQDVLLSSIFGRPLAVSRFTCRISNEIGGDPSSRIERPTSYQEALCEFSVLARRHLNEDQEQEWDDEQVAEFKKDLLSWYNALPSSMALNFADSTTGKQTLRDQLSQRSSFYIQHSVDLCLQLQFALLSLFRNRLVVRESMTMQVGATPQQPRLDENSLRQCGRCVHNITLALSALVDLLGSLQAGMLWVRVFYAFHAGVTAAYLALSRTTTTYGVQAREDLKTLTDVSLRLPDRFDGLKTVKATFGVLSKLVQVHAEQPQVVRKDSGPNAIREFSVRYNLKDAATSETPPRMPTTSVSFSPSQLDELLTTNNFGTPAFNIARDPTISSGGGLAPVFDLPTHPTSSSAMDGQHHFSSPTLGGGGGGGGVFGTRTPPVGLPPSSSSHHPSASLDAAFTFSSANAATAGQLPGSRPDRGFPEPFGPMIAPPGPDASTSEIVSFWREFFALPFQTSDLELS